MHTPNTETAGPKPVARETVLAQLQWRCAVKKFDPARKISAADWHALEEALVLTPTSFGLQHARFIVVDDPDRRAQLVPVSWGQTQPVDCSHYLVFAIRNPLTADDVERHLDRIAAVREVPRASLEPYRQMMLGSLRKAEASGFLNEWSARQAYIALGNFMTCAALLGIDTCPMEGIEPENYDAILGLPGQGLKTIVACAAGYRAADDKYGQMKKVRYPVPDMIVRI